jgi:hypothetical protein
LKRQAILTPAPRDSDREASLTELSDLTARLVAELPEDAIDLSIRQLDAVAELFDRIADRLSLSEKRLDAMLELATERGFRPGGQPVDYLTGTERAAFEAGELRALDARRAYAALTRARAC